MAFDRIRNRYTRDCLPDFEIDRVHVDLDLARIRGPTLIHFTPSLFPGTRLPRFNARSRGDITRRLGLTTLTFFARRIRPTFLAFMSGMLAPRGLY